MEQNKFRLAGFERVSEEVNTLLDALVGKFLKVLGNRNGLGDGIPILFLESLRDLMKCSGSGLKVVPDIQKHFSFVAVADVGVSNVTEGP